MVLLPKKDGSLHFCIDYRRVNAVTKKDVYSLPRVDDIVDTLGDAKYFTMVDLASGYWQVKLVDDARPKTAFTTHQGLFEFIRMTLQCTSDVLEHLQHLEEVMDRLRKARLRLKPKKCHFLCTEVSYLGHIISAQGVCPDPEKIDKVKHFPVSRDVSKARQFLGLASYYCRFEPQFAKIAAPIHGLLKKENTFAWTSECDTAFRKLKEALTSAPVLIHPKFGPEHEFVLETDASYIGLGAVLSQPQEDGRNYPVAYASRSLDQHKRKYAVTELEMLAIMWAVRYFRAYLLGHRTMVFIDHSACTSLLNHPRPLGKLARWALTIQDKDLVIKYQSGKSNANTDTLSHSPVSLIPMSCNVVCPGEGKDKVTCTDGVKELHDFSQSSCCGIAANERIACVNPST